MMIQYSNFSCLTSPAYNFRSALPIHFKNVHERPGRNNTINYRKWALETAGPPKKKKKESRPENEQLEKQLRDLNLLKCQPCNLIFTSYNNMAVHRTVVHKQQYKCKSAIYCCNARFVSRQGAYDHRRYHSDENAFKCPDCGRLHLCGKTLHRHRCIVHSYNSNAFVCTTCGVVFKNSAYLLRHRFVHVDPEQRRFHCPNCERSKWNDLFSFWFCKVILNILFIVLQSFTINGKWSDIWKRYTE